MSQAQDLRVVEAFADLDDEQIRWLADHARIVTVEPGEVLFHEGDPTNVMYAVLEGEIRARGEKGAADGAVIVRPAGKITGMLPLSRLTHSPVTGRATIRARVACFSTELFPEMLRRIPVLQSRLAAIMVDRSREFTRFGEQREKLIGLGRLSAGLAHELNNPAAAIQRRVEALSQRLDDLSAIARAGLERGGAPAALEPLRELSAASRADHHAVPGSDALERTDAEEALSGWLEAHGLPDAWLAAETLVSAGVSAAELEAATHGLPRSAFETAVQWLAADLASHRLVDDIAEAARRIVELIAAVKSYSNMDRAPTMNEVDVHDGIRSTLAMLAHKLREKNVALRLELTPDLARVTANPGQLNQVWTNLVDNAVDAVAEGGEIVVRTSSNGAEVVVQVIDDGPGIPVEAKTRIFEPFFSTKDVGEGTGLGLDIVHRIVQAHGATVEVESVPGRTCFEVRLPASSTDADSEPG